MPYFLKVERVHVDERTERFKVSAKSEFWLFENNRPLFRNRGMKTRRIDWKLVEGRRDYQSTFEKIADALQEAIE